MAMVPRHRCSPSRSPATRRSIRRTTRGRTSTPSPPARPSRRASARGCGPRSRLVNETGPVNDAIVKIEGLAKRFGAVTAVDGVDLEIARGELFALLGGSGCGKTTLLRLLAGLETPDSGRILIDGQDMTGVPAHRRPVNMMFQSYALFPHMDVAANVGYGLRREARPAAEIHRRVTQTLALVQLKDLGDRMPSQLSGGQRQRVALARALVKEPKLLLL